MIIAMEKNKAGTRVRKLGNEVVVREGLTKEGQQSRDLREAGCMEKHSRPREQHVHCFTARTCLLWSGDNEEAKERSRVGKGENGRRRGSGGRSIGSGGGRRWLGASSVM